jgi:hypothetical protein
MQPLSLLLHGFPFCIIFFPVLLSAVFLSVTLGLASLVIIITILIIRLYHKPDDYTVPDWLHRMVYKYKKKPSTRQSVRTFRECTSPDDVRPASNALTWETLFSLHSIPRYRSG